MQKLHAWRRQGAEIVYLTSRSEPKEVDDIRYLLDKFDFPDGELFFRRAGEAYRDVAERVLPEAGGIDHLPDDLAAL